MSNAAENIEFAQRHYRNNIPFDLDGGLGERAAIGLIVLSSDQTVEHEFRLLTDIEGVALYHSRIENSPAITPETLLQMEQKIPGCADLILKGVHLDVVAYGCTSASMVIGEECVFERIRSVRPKAKCTTPITAAFAAFDAFDARNLAVLTPYRQDVNDKVADYIEVRGYRVTAFGSFNEEDDNKAARISAASIKSAAIELGSRSDVDMVFVSCTNLRVASIVNDIESSTGKPATSSNHAMAWHCLRLAGIADSAPQHGRLFER